jgi:hemoglobin
MFQDITTEKDVKLLVDSFYAKVNKDPLLSPIFNEVAQVDWETHLPKMYRFWGTLLIGTMNYNGSSFTPHARLPISEKHFNRWLDLFKQTVDEHFEGNNATIAKERAQGIASVFLYKLDAAKST